MKQGFRSKMFNAVLNALVEDQKTRLRQILWRKWKEIQNL